jgi:hypothetical protein
MGEILMRMRAIWLAAIVTAAEPSHAVLGAW